MNFSVKDMGIIKSDSILNQIATKVFQIGRNVHLLMLLGKLHTLNETKLTG